MSTLQSVKAPLTPEQREKVRAFMALCDEFANASDTFTLDDCPELSVTTGHLADDVMDTIVELKGLLANDELKASLATAPTTEVAAS